VLSTEQQDTLALDYLGLLDDGVLEEVSGVFDTLDAKCVDRPSSYTISFDELSRHKGCLTSMMRW